MAGGKLQFDGEPPSLIPGKTALISIGEVDPDAYRSARLELRLVEKKPRFQDAGKPPVQVVSRALASPGTTSVQLRVPQSLVPAYQGATITWEYEIHLIGDKFGRDHRIIRSVEISPQAPTHRSTTGRALSSQPLKFSGLVRTHGISKGRNLIFAAIAGVVAVSFAALPFLWAPENDQTSSNSLAANLVAWIFAAFVGAISLYWLWTVMLSPARQMNRVLFAVAEPRIKKGDQIKVEIDTKGLSDLEIGVVYTEIRIVRERHGDGGRSEIIIERFQPVVDGIVRLPTLPNDPPTYAGGQIALHCLVELRSTKFELGAGRINVTVDP